MKKKIVMFYPYVTEGMKIAVNEVLGSRFIGQGPKVDEFEEKFKQKFDIPYAISVNSGSAAIETACDLIGLKAGDKVITTPLTCTATNLPLIRRGCELIWTDIREDTLNLDQTQVDLKLKEHDIKAIMNVHLGGIKSDIIADVPIIDDSAQALGMWRKEATYTCYSFQAIKHLTTGDGGMLVTQSEDDARTAKLLRWFGIDREIKERNDWQAFKERKMIFDIELAGHKRQMTDIAAAMGIAALDEFDYVMEHRRKIFELYSKELKPALRDSSDNAHWLATLLIDDRNNFCKELHDHNIETNIVQARNDIYKIFGGKRQNLPVMNSIEDNYISIPLNMKVSLEDAQYICNIIKSGW